MEKYSKVYLYRLIQEKTKELLSHVREASNVKELVVFGHDPGITKQIVHRIKAGKVHMFTGHLHRGFRQSWIDKWQRVRHHWGHASPSWGAGGVEQVISPFGYAIHIDTWGIREIVPISPEKYMREMEAMI